MEQDFCKNCNTELSGSFCSNCGQKTKTVRLNKNYLLDEIKYTFLHVNKGLLYTIKELYTRPGESIKEFIEGKRIQHYKPLLLVFVLAGINGYLASQMNMKEMMQEYNMTPSMDKAKQAVFMTEYLNCVKWAFNHWALMEILAIPIVSFISWISFKKWGYNYIENIIINSFAAGQRLVFGIFSSIIYLCLPINYVSKTSWIASLVTFGLTIWTYASLYQKQDSRSLLLRIILFLFLLFVFAILFFVVFGIGFGYYLVRSGKIQI